MTDQDLLGELQELLLEPNDSGASWPSGLWTPSEVIGYLNEVQRDFIARTHAVMGWFEFDLPALTELVALPDEWVATASAELEYPAGSAAWWPLPALGRSEADLLLAGWAGTSQRPLGYLERQQGSKYLQPVPLAAVAARVHLVAAVLPEVCTGTGVPLAVADPWLPFVQAGVLARMLGKQGRAYDGPRAAAAQAWYDQGVALAQATLGGL